MKPWRWDPRTFHTPVYGLDDNPVKVFKGADQVFLSGFEGFGFLGDLDERKLALNSQVDDAAAVLIRRAERIRNAALRNTLVRGVSAFVTSSRSATAAATTEAQLATVAAAITRDLGRFEAMIVSASSGTSRPRTPRSSEAIVTEDVAGASTGLLVFAGLAMAAAGVYLLTREG